MFNTRSLDAYYKGKTVLVTGHTGFKGSWLTVWLKKMGANVIGFSDKYRENDPSGLKWLSNVVPIEYRADEEILANIEDKTAVLNAFKIYKPDITFHLAAQAIVKTSYDNPYDTFTTNFIGSLNVINAFKEVFANDSNTKKRSLVMITSDKCYQNIEQIWGYTENDRMGGDDPYSASKGATELMINAYMKSFFAKYNATLGVASVRAGNVIGGGDCSANRLIPDCIRAITNYTDINIRNPKATRPWCHVLDVICGYLITGMQCHNNPQKYSSNYNFGPELSDNVDVSEVAKAVVQYFRHFDNRDNTRVIIDDAEHQAECGLLFLNTTRAYRELQWKRKLCVADALRYTAEWYYNQLNDADMYMWTLKQIDEYYNRDIALTLSV